MSDLNTLSNKQLREKCLQYGLPNVPVTDSSRNILIKRLNAVISGKAPTKKGTDKAASPTNRRKTVAATITTTISSGDEDDINVTTKRTSNTSRRRTTAPTVPESSKINNNISTAAAKLSQTYNQHIVPMDIVGRATSTQINEGHTTDPRQRRSVSLSKTGVLTTSYSQETVPLRTTYEQNRENDFEEVQEDEVDDVEMESVPEVHAKPIYNETSYNRSNLTQNDYTQFGFNANKFITQSMPPPLEPSKPKLYPSLHDTGLQQDYYNSLNDILASHSSSVRQSNLGFTYNPPTSYVPAPPSPPAATSTMRQTIAGSGFGAGLSSSPIQNTTSSYQTSATKRYTVGGATKRHTARTIDDEQGASSSDEQYDAPYLNKFSRNLDNFKAEPLGKRTATSYTTAASPPIVNRYSSYSPAAPKRRRGTYEDENGITFTQFWATLEQKYHLKQTLFLIMCFVAAVFIYVFFLQ